MKKTKPTRILALLAVSLTLFSCSDLPNENKEASITTKNPTASEKNTTEEAPQTPSISIDAKTLTKDYEANEVSADNKYKGKLLKITGKIESINKDFSDQIFVNVEGNPETFSNLHCEFEDAAIAASFKKGQKIEFTGTCDGLIMGSPVIKECVLVK